jgi:hypothetical protein
LNLLGASKRKPFFRFHNQETETVYDPPTTWSVPRTSFWNLSI